VIEKLGLDISKMAATPAGKELDVPMRDSPCVERLTIIVYPSASSQNVEAEGAIPCIDTDFPNVDIDDDNLDSQVIALTYHKNNLV
jgi:hypothetical protein